MDKANPCFEDLAEQYADAIQDGNRPSISSYAVDHPEFADQIRRLFPVIEMMESKGGAIDDFSEEGLLEAELKQLQSTPPLRQLGDYRIVREIGRGGMGIVFEAQQESLGRKVALKLLPRSSQFDQRRQTRFENEARASAMLHHTNIVPIFGVGAQDETSYFVMQYIDGQPLNVVLHEIAKQRSEASKNVNPENIATESPTSTIAHSLSSAEDWGAVDEPPTTTTSTEVNANTSDVSSIVQNSSSGASSENVYWRNTAKLGVQVADALNHAHSKKILHRDIKPSNLMIDQAGCAWVTDFGLAKYFESPDLTKTGEIVGTLRYMSPEQINGTTDERSDIFGLGLTLYEMAALRPAYDAPNRNQLMRQVLEAAPPSPRSIDRKIPRDLETIIQKCIAAEPNRRYSNAADVAVDLQRFLDGEPVMARRINPLERISKWCRRRPAVASLIAALVVSLVGGIVGISWQWSKTADALVMANKNLEEAKLQTRLANDEKTKAAQQATIATAEKARAEKHFKQARDSVNQFFNTVTQQRLLNEPGFLPLRKELLTNALDYHREFVSQYQDDDNVRLEYAVSLYRINEIEGQIGGGPELLKKLDQPIEIFRELTDEEPDEPLFQVWLARCIAMKSTMLQRVNSIKAFELLKESVKILEEVKAIFGRSEIADIELAKNYQILGLAFESIDRATGKTDRALEAYTKAFAIRAELYENAPKNIDYAIYFADINRDLGITRRKMGEFDNAAEHYNLALATLEPIVADNPDHILARRALASISVTVGFFYGSGKTNKEYDKALKHYQISKDNYQILAQQNPLVIEYQDGLARAASNAGGVQQVTGNLEAALENRELAAKARKKLCEQNPKAVYLRSGWAVSLNGVGSTLRDMGNIEASLAKHQEALEQHTQALKMDPNQNVVRVRLIDGLIQITRTLSQKQDFAAAIANLDSVDEFLLPEFSRPHFSKGVEFTIIAGKIGDVERKSEERDEDLTELKQQCIDKAKSQFSQAQKMGFPVLKQSRITAALQPSNTRPESLEIQDWLENELPQTN